MNEYSRSFHFDFDHPVDKLWAVVADTPRWGEACGLPKYQSTEQLADDGTVEVIAEVSIAGKLLRWQEPPANWVAEKWFEQRRRFLNGPFVSMTTRARLENRDSRSRLGLEIGFVPRNPAGWLLARSLVGKYPGKVQRILDVADRLICAEQPDLFETDFQLSSAARGRVQRFRRSIAQTRFHHGLADRLLEYITGKQEVDLWNLRPFALARRWRVEPRLAVELFLQSVREGILESRWDVLCPRCRVSKAKASDIADIPGTVHCAACNIDYDADFARNVELSFSPSPSIRPVEYGFYCRSGPGFTPHVKAQCTLQAGESRTLPVALAPGRYRIRTLEAGDELDYDHGSAGLPGIVLADTGPRVEQPSSDNDMRFRNESRFQRTVVIEDRAWLDDVLTAERATTLQAFRDLFSDQVLRPGDEISIRNISFVFTDLVDSSRLFAEVGDAEAYHRVRAHFALLGDIVRRHGGTVVKTVGDGVHAAFLTPESALQASIEMQQAVKGFEADSRGNVISIRIGINSGSSISVNLNDRLDYYGKTVNLAARLEGQGRAGQITMSRTFVEDPAVAELLRRYAPVESEATIKGFRQPVPIYQISP